MNHFELVDETDVLVQREIDIRTGTIRFELTHPLDKVDVRVYVLVSKASAEALSDVIENRVCQHQTALIYMRNSLTPSSLPVTPSVRYLVIPAGRSCRLPFSVACCSYIFAVLPTRRLTYMRPFFRFPSTYTSSPITEGYWTPPSVSFRLGSSSRWSSSNWQKRSRRFFETEVR